jgi:hypothetical protein
MINENGSILAASLALVLMAAKSHGRQVRLERERAGYPTVVTGTGNPPWVEALWRRDRIHFWAAFGAGVSLAVSYALAAARMFWPMPLRDADGNLPWWSFILFTAVWPFAAAFLVSGLASLARLALSFRGRLPSDPRRPKPGGTWLLKAWLGSLGWWIPTLALAVGIAFVSFRPSP